MGNALSRRFQIVLLVSALAAAHALGGCSGHEIDGNSGRQAAGSITLTTLYSSVVADGASRTRLEALVLGTNRSPIPGAMVKFSTTGGILVPFDEDSTDPEGPELSARANSHGVARVYLESGAVAGSATVTASAGKAAAALTVAFVAGPPDRVILVARPNNLTADGVSRANVTAYVFDRSENLTDTQLTVDQPSDGSVDKVVVATAGGSATFTYTAGGTPGDVPLRVTTRNDVVGETTVTLIPAPVGSVSLSIDKTRLVADGGASAEGQALVSVTVLGPTGVPVAGVQPTVTTTLGLLSEDLSAPGGVRVNGPLTDGQGQSRLVLRSSAHLGSALVTATAGGKSSSLTVPFLGGAASRVVLTASPSSLPADGKSKSTLTAVVYDANGNPTETLLTIDRPSVGEVDRVTAPTAGGVASFSYTAGAVAGSVTLRVTTSEGRTGTANLLLVAPPAPPAARRSP